VLDTIYGYGMVFIRTTEVPMQIEKDIHHPIDFHSAVINRMVVGSDYKLNQFVTWNGDNLFCVYEFVRNQTVVQVDRFELENGCHQYDAIDHAKQYFVDTHNFRVYA